MNHYLLEYIMKVIFGKFDFKSIYSLFVFNLDPKQHGLETV
jgi:hypothetical protein